MFNSQIWVLTKINIFAPSLCCFLNFLWESSILLLSFFSFFWVLFCLDNCKFMRRSDGGSWPWKQIWRFLCCCSDSAQHRQMESKKGFVDVKVVNEEGSSLTSALGTVATLLTSALLTTHLISRVSSLLLCFCFCFSCKLIKVKPVISYNSL